MAKRIWTEEEIRGYVQTNDKVLYGAIRRLYNEQTIDEQSAGYTKHFNNRGFNGADSKFMSSIARFLIKNGYLSDKQKHAFRKRMMKYTKQLTRLANEA